VVKGPGGPSGLMGYATGLFGKQIRPAAGTIPLPPNVDDLLWGNVYNGMTVSAESIDGKKEAVEKPGSARPLGPTGSEKPRIEEPGSASTVRPSGPGKSEEPGSVRPSDSTEFVSHGAPKTFSDDKTSIYTSAASIKPTENISFWDTETYYYHQHINDAMDILNHDIDYEKSINSLIDNGKKIIDDPEKNLKKLQDLNKKLKAEIQTATDKLLLKQEEYKELNEKFKSLYGKSDIPKETKNKLDMLLDVKTKPSDAKKIYEELSNDYEHDVLEFTRTGGSY
jgi:hypothetical protein